jgi:hypothetical protein
MFATPLQGPEVRSSLVPTFVRRLLRPGHLVRAIATILLLCTSLFAVGRASAAVITYELTPEAGNRWTYQYTVSAAASDPAIEEFTIFFDPALYANLLRVLAPSGWDALVIEPDPGLPADGFFDALALVAGIAPGSSLGGFAVSFDFLGNGRPGVQGFDIVDPVTFGTISSGITELERAIDLPEPGTAWLLAVPLLLLLRSRSRCPADRSATLPAN